MSAIVRNVGRRPECRPLRGGVVSLLIVARSAQHGSATHVHGADRRKHDMHDTCTATEAAAIYWHAAAALRAGDITAGIGGMIRLAWAP